MSMRIGLSAILFASVLTVSTLVIGAVLERDEYVQVSGFQVSISPGAPGDEGRWQTLDGGTLTFHETQGATIGTDKYQSTETGIAEFTEVTLTRQIEIGGGKMVTKLVASAFDTDLNPHVAAIHMEPLVFPAVPASDGRAQQHKTFQPGQPQLGHATFTINEHPDSANDIAQWVSDTYEGKSVRRDITVNLRQSARGETVRSYTFMDCLPIYYAPISGLNSGTAGGVNKLRLKVTCNRVEFDGLPADVSEWMRAMMQTKDASSVYRTVEVTLLDRAGAELRQQEFNEAFITQYTFPELDASSEEILVEGIAFQPGYWGTITH